jgi:polar amino acid transport system substrate-binding protein
MLTLYSERLPGSRVLEGRYTVIEHAVATPKGKAAATQYVRQFVEESKADGTVRDAIAKANLRRANLGP